MPSSRCSAAVQPDCAAAVRIGLDAIEVARARPGPFQEVGRAWEEVVQYLAALPDDCSKELRQAVERLLESMPDAKEGDLLVMLEAVQRRDQPEAAELIVRTIEDPATSLKEDYAALLDELGREDLVVATLVRALDAGVGGPPRPDASLLINALHSRRAGEALEAVRPYVAHREPSARGAALGFLWNYDDSRASGLLVDRLGRETDRELLEAIIDTLLALDCRDAIPALRAFSRDLRHAQNLRAAADAAAEELAADASR